MSLNASDSGKTNNDDDEEGAHGDAAPPKKRHRNKKSDPTSSSSSEDALTSDLKRINDKKDQKLNKDITIAVNAVFKT